MERLTLMRGTVLATGLVLLGLGTALAQTTPYEPQVGQAGKDVVWVPSPDSQVNNMLDLAKVTASDFVMDLGSGDGRTVIAAAKRGARALGVEYNPEMVTLSQQRVREAGVADRAAIRQGDLFETNLSEATVITMFLLPDINLKLRPKILDLKPGTRIVSNSFTMGEWEEDQSERVTEDCSSWCTALLWIVPAKVAGDWQLGSQTLRLEQTYQMLSGSLGGAAVSGKMNGENITLTVGGQTYTGRVNGTSMTGTISSGGTFSATRR